MSTPETPWPRRFALPLAAVAAYLLGVLVSLLAMTALEAKRQAFAAQRFGTALAEQLAARAEEPLLRQDRVRLGVAANRAAAATEVRQVAIHTMDGRPFVVAGAPPGTDARTYVQPVTVADEVTGEVRITLTADAFAAPFGRVVTIAGPFWAAGLALTCLAAFFGGRMFAWWRGDGRQPGPETPPALATPPVVETAGKCLVVANLFADTDLRPQARERALAAAAEIAGRVAAVYSAEVAPPPRAGCTVVLGDATPERMFNAVCAALLLRGLLERWQDQQVAQGEALLARPGPSPRLFRYAVEHCGPDEAAAATDSELASEVLLLSSLVRNGEIAMGKAGLAAVEGLERLLVAPFDNPAAAVLPGLAAPSGVVSGLAAEHEAALQAQADAIATEMGL